MAKIKWLEQPESHDYPAALSYLSLHMDEKDAKAFVNKLEKVEMTKFKAKDIFRASKLSLLGVSNSHVESNRKKIKKGIPLSPILLVRYKDSLLVADGYHRLCAVYSISEDLDIPVKIV